MRYADAGRPRTEMWPVPTATNAATASMPNAKLSAAAKKLRRITATALGPPQFCSVTAVMPWASATRPATILPIVPTTIRITGGVTTRIAACVPNRRRSHHMAIPNSGNDR